MSDTAVQESPEQQVATCRHHWVIAAPEGATSMGRCKVCGETREFRNSAGDSFWERDGGDTGGSSWKRPLATAGAAEGPADDGY